MIAASDLLADLYHVAASETSSARVLGELADLLLRQGQRCSREGLAVFDVALEHFVGAAGLDTRADLARRLADAREAPPQILMTLAFDEIAVAAPILTRSRGISDVDLMALASTKGRAHLLAICGRTALSEPVTDVLVGRADDAVSCAVADNVGARLSPTGVSLLVDQARSNDRLGDGLGARPDLSLSQVQDLAEAVRERERERLRAQLNGAPAIDASRPNARACTTVSPEHARMAMERLAALGRLDEPQLALFASEGRHAEAIAAVSVLTGLPTSYVSGLFGPSENDLLLAIARALDWSWQTCAMLLKLRNTSVEGARGLWRAEEVFRSMPISTARQAMRFLQAHNPSSAVTP